MNCSVLALSVVSCFVLLTLALIFMFITVTQVQQRVRRVRVEKYACCVNKLPQNVGLQTEI